MENIKLHNLIYTVETKTVWHIDNDTGIPIPINPNQNVKLFMGFNGKRFNWIQTNVLSLAIKLKLYMDGGHLMFFKYYGYIEPYEIQSVWTKNEYKSKHDTKNMMKRDRNIAILNIRNNCEFIRHHARTCV
jgi:hypothetical protein